MSGPLVVKKLEVGNPAIYRSRELGSGMTREDEVKILAIANVRAKVAHRFGKPSWVNISNLRPI